MSVFTIRGRGSRSAARGICTEAFVVAILISLAIGAVNNAVFGQLSPVIITSPQKSDVVMYDGTTWVNKPSVFNVKAFGAVGNGSADDTAAIQAAINAAGAVIGTAQGAWVEFPTGVFIISSRLTMPNCVSLRGQGRGTIIRNWNGFTDTRMIVASNGTSSMFNSRIVDLVLDWENVNVPNSAVIEAKAWQENCGLEHVVITEFNNIGVYINTGYGGAAYLKFRDVEIFSSPNFSNTTGIRVDQISSVGAFVLDVEGATIAGANNNSTMAHAIDLANDSAIIKGLHLECVANGVHPGPQSKVLIMSSTGAFGANVVSLCKIESNFLGTVTMIGCQRNGANYLINNLVTGELITTDPPIYTYPTALAPNTAKHWVTFAGSNGAVQQSSGGVSVTRTSTGDYTITWPQAFANSNYCYTVMHSAGSLGLTQQFSKTSSALRLRTFNWSGSGGASASSTDPSQVYVVAYAVK